MSEAFRSGMANWNSIASNINDARKNATLKRQGDQRLSQDQRRINLQEKKDKRAWKIDKGKAKRDQQASDILKSKWDFDKETYREENKARLAKSQAEARGLERDNTGKAIENVFKPFQLGLGLAKDVVGISKSSSEIAETYRRTAESRERSKEAKAVTEREDKRRHNLNAAQDDLATNLKKVTALANKGTLTREEFKRLQGERRSINARINRYGGGGGGVSGRSTSGKSNGDDVYESVKENLAFKLEEDANDERILHESYLSTWMKKNPRHGKSYISAGKRIPIIDELLNTPNLTPEQRTQYLREKDIVEGDQNEIETKAIVAGMFKDKKINYARAIAAGDSIWISTDTTPMRDQDGVQMVHKETGRILFHTGLNKDATINAAAAFLDRLEEQKKGASTFQRNLAAGKRSLEGTTTTKPIGTEADTPDAIQAAAGVGAVPTSTQVKVTSETTDVPAETIRSTTTGLPALPVGIDQDAFFVDPDIEKLESGISLSDFEEKQIREADEKQRLFDENMPLAPEGFFDGTTPATPATPDSSGEQTEEKVEPPPSSPTKNRSRSRRGQIRRTRSSNPQAESVSENIFGDKPIRIEKDGVSYRGFVDADYMMSELSKALGEGQSWDTGTGWDRKKISLKTRIPHGDGYITQNRKIHFREMPRGDYERMIKAVKEWRKGHIKREDLRKPRP